MAWARLDDNFPDHPKVLPLSDSAFRLHVTAICYASRLETDGVISQQALRRMDATKKDVASLVNAGLWEIADGREYSIHDFLVYNPGREKVEERRLARAEAGRIGGQRSGVARRSKREANASKQSEANGSKQTPKHLLEAKTNPVPSRPVPNDSLRSSSSPMPPDDDAAAEMDIVLREFRDTAISKLPAKMQRDPLAWDEMDSLARDYAFRPQAAMELAEAIDSCRRENLLPFAANLRKHLPKLPVRAPQFAGVAAEVVHLPSAYRRQEDE